MTQGSENISKAIQILLQSKTTAKLASRLLLAPIKALGVAISISLSVPILFYLRFWLSQVSLRSLSGLKALLLRRTVGG